MELIVVDGERKLNSLYPVSCRVQKSQLSYHPDDGFLMQE